MSNHSQNIDRLCWKLICYNAKLILSWSLTRYLVPNLVVCTWTDTQSRCGRVNIMMVVIKELQLMTLVHVPFSHTCSLMLLELQEVPTWSTIINNSCVVKVLFLDHRRSQVTFFLSFFLSSSSSTLCFLLFMNSVRDSCDMSLAVRGSIATVTTS